MAEEIPVPPTQQPAESDLPIAAPAQPDIGDSDAKPGSADVQGESNYDAARKFDEDQTRFAANAEAVERGAKAAAKALDDPKEGPELEQAEAETGHS